MIVKASIGFVNTDTAQALANKTDIIYAAMTTARGTFVTPVPPLETIDSANSALKVAILNAADGGRELNAIKRAKQAEVVSLLRQLAAYVTSTANGDMAVLISSGFPIQKPTRSKIGQLPAPAVPKVLQGKESGQLNASTPPVYGASSYNWRLALTSSPNTYVQTAQTVGAKCEFKGLIPGELYNVQANAVGAAGPSDFSGTGQLRVI
jgi:hypothetical protein